MSDAEHLDCNNCPKRAMLLADLGKFSVKIEQLSSHPLLSRAQRTSFNEAEDFCRTSIEYAMQLCQVADECTQPEDLSYFDPTNTVIRSHVAHEKVVSGSNSQLVVHPHILNVVRPQPK